MMEHTPSRTLAYKSDTHDTGLRVPVTEISLAPSPDGTPNDPVRVYRTQGPGSDPVRGLAPAREPWVVARGDTEEYDGRRRDLADDGRGALRRGAATQEWQGERRRPRRARPGRTVTQMHYARQGVITPRCGSSRCARAATSSWSAARSPPGARSSPTT
nr:hypothetical protein GCM10025730_25410 [Promicromonospora thailandica]